MFYKNISKLFKISGILVRSTEFKYRTCYLLAVFLLATPSNLFSPQFHTFEEDPYIGLLWGDKTTHNFARGNGFQNSCEYVCMYVCVCVCVYTCMHTCMYYLSFCLFIILFWDRVLPCDSGWPRTLSIDHIDQAGLELVAICLPLYTSWIPKTSSKTSLPHRLKACIFYLTEDWESEGRVGISDQG